MKFRRGSAYSLVSQCGEYSVAKVILDGAVTYEAWHLPKETAGRQIALSTRQSTSLDAIGVCRRHAETRGKNAA